MPKFDINYFEIPVYNNSSDNCISKLYNLTNIQYYNPIYKTLFDINNENLNNISLNHQYHFIENNLVFNNKNKQFINKNTFFKFSPIYDPLHYLIGKFKNYENFYQLPLYNEPLDCNKYIYNYNNSSYIDNFFCFINSIVLNNHNFINALDYYGSIMALQTNFKLDIADDVDYLINSNFFTKNINTLYTLDNNKINSYIRLNTSKKIKKPINISDQICFDFDIIELPNVHNNKTPKYINNIENISEFNINNNNNDNIINVRKNSESDDSENDDSESDDSESDDSKSDECINIYIKKYPIQAICMEKCVNTLDFLLETSSLSSHEGICCLFQIIMTLLCFQKCFHFTHNDLHTNNVMYIETEEEYIYYKYNNKYFKVPTYGKIFKIIDYGRAIYKFNGTTYCSNNFAPGGSAYTQYNCEPYFNPNKKRIEPNYSFDLCRLGCSIYDFIIDIDDDKNTFNDLQHVIDLWCKDDYGKNILYKKNGQERYSDFKIYKMIARTVNQHTPEMQLQLPYFKTFEVQKNSFTSNNIIDIDDIPIYV